MPSKLSKGVVLTGGKAKLWVTGSGRLLICEYGARSCSGITLLTLCQGTGVMSRNARGVVTWAVALTTIGFLCTCCADAKKGASRRNVPIFLQIPSNFMRSPSDLFRWSVWLFSFDLYEPA